MELRQAVNCVYHPLHLPNPLAGVIDKSPLSPERLLISTYRTSHGLEN
jgi:hypothetical protein